MWRLPNQNDLLATLSDKELELFRSDDPCSQDPVQSLLERTAEMIRSYIRANHAIRIAPQKAMLPESLISPAMDYAAYDILKRKPIPVGEDRRKARDAATLIFEKVSKNEITPESYSPQTSETAEIAAIAYPAFCSPSPRRTLD